MMQHNLFQLMGLSLLLMCFPLTRISAQESMALPQQPLDSVATATEHSTLSAVEAAAEAYRAGDFRKSIQLYELLVKEALARNSESAALYYNLGNAYFRDNQLAKAILNYERAYLLEPGNGDIRHNLRFAQNMTEDRIEHVGIFFLQDWFKSVRDLNSSNRWGVISIIFFLLFLICVALFLFLRHLWSRKTAFYGGILFLLLMIVSTSFAFSQKKERTQRNGAIVMVGAAAVNASPDLNSNRLFELHEGTKVNIKSSDGNWYEVEIDNGSIGWTEQKNVELI